MRSWLLAVVSATALVACTQAVPDVATPPPVLACTMPHRILDQASPFAAALAQWSKAPVGDRAALAALDHACDEAGEPDARPTESPACTLLGYVYASGEGVPRSFGRAMTYFQRSRSRFDFRGGDLAEAADQRIFAGFSTHCYVGMSCDAGCESMCTDALEQLRGELEPPLTTACARGRGTACAMLRELDGAYVMNVGRIATRAKLDPDALAKKACAHGVGSSCDDEHQACAAGWPGGCLSIGNALTANDRAEEAVAWWEKSCALGQTNVCNDLGDILSQGDGVPVDHERAVRAYANAWRQ